MSQRRKFNSQFKFKVIVEALSERLPLYELAKKYELHPNQITTWKKEFLKNGADFFGKEKGLEVKDDVHIDKVDGTTTLLQTKHSILTSSNGAIQNLESVLKYLREYKNFLLEISLFLFPKIQKSKFS